MESKQHPRFVHGLTDTRIYRVWVQMRRRCRNANDHHYCDYGGRGITICPQWEDFLPFYHWAMANGYRDDLSIDRIDNDGNYEPSNCRWADDLTQSRNRRSTKLTQSEVDDIRALLVEGSLTQSDIAKLFGVTQPLVSYIKRGLTWADPTKHQPQCVTKMRGDLR